MAIYVNDEYMYYDIKTHRYILTNKYFSDTYGEDLNLWKPIKKDNNPSTAPDRFLKRVSLILYNYILTHNQDSDIAEYLLAGGNPEWRKPLMEALGELTYSIYISGNDFSIVTGLNLDKLNLNKDDIEKNYIPISVDLILQSNDMLFTGKRIIRTDYKKLKQEGEY